MIEIETKKYKDFEINIIPVVVDERVGINYIFIIRCFRSGKVICIDPGESKLTQKFLEDNNLNLDFILITHYHFDHISGIEDLKEKYNCKVLVFEKDQKSVAGGDIFIKLDKKLLDRSGLTLNVTRETIESNKEIIDQDLNVTRETDGSSNKKLIEGDFQLGEIIFTPLATFGHCANHISYFIDSDNILFPGDTIFSSGCGRVSFDGSYEDLYQSLESFKSLPLNSEIYCAHEYSVNNINFALTLEPNNKDLLRKEKLILSLINKNRSTIPTTIESELKTNPFLRCDSLELRNNLGLSDKIDDLEVFKIIRKMKDQF